MILVVNCGQWLQVVVSVVVILELLDTYGIKLLQVGAEECRKSRVKAIELEEQEKKKTSQAKRYLAGHQFFFDFRRFNHFPIGE